MHVSQRRYGLKRFFGHSNARHGPAMAIERLPFDNGASMYPAQSFIQIWRNVSFPENFAYVLNE